MLGFLHAAHTHRHLTIGHTFAAELCHLPTDSVRRGACFFMKTAIILGTQSFLDGGTKVGSQYLAEALADAGWQVDYVATPSSLLDIWGRKRHARLRRVWTQQQDTRGVALRSGLTEWAFKAPFPALKLFLRWRWQLAAYSCWVPSAMQRRTYDVCITDVTPNMLYLPWVQATTRVLRLNDWPPGFSHDLHSLVIEEMEAGLRNASFDEVWAVSRPLADYASRHNPRNQVLFLPNGVENTFLTHCEASRKQANTAVYIGNIGAWFDIDLIRKAAVLLPHWRIDVYGPGSHALSDLPPNVKGKGSVARTDVPSLLSQYSVGLIPFADTDGRMAYVERPLKFYEYIAANLGVASTQYGGMRSGMGDLATYGNTAADFAQAIVQAQSQAQQRAPDFGAAFVREHAWGHATRKAQDRLHALTQAAKSVQP